jgi:hypothetical protein
MSAKKRKRNKPQRPPFPYRWKQQPPHPPDTPGIIYLNPVEVTRCTVTVQKGTPQPMKQGTVTVKNVVKKEPCHS